MFDKADLLSLPCQVPICASIASDRTRQQSGLGGASAVVPREVGVVEGYDADARGQHLMTHQTPSVAVEDQPGPCSMVTSTYVVEACAMDGENVALALSDGRLCYADLSRSTEPLAAPLAEQEDSRWPDWECWRSRHGNIEQLAFSPTHDAIMTLEKATTAAGDQLFLGTYHRPQSAGVVGASDRGRGEDSRWSGCSIPLGASRARMAVCPCRGWAAVCTGSMVNLWVVGRSGGARRTRTRTIDRNSAWNGENGRGHRQTRQTQAAGFEHALAVDLAELVGFVEAEGGNDGGTKHAALFGNTLAVATDHAIFLLTLTFDVRGESHKARTAAAVSSPSAPAATESLSMPPPAATDPQPAASSRKSPKANNPRGRSDSSRTSRPSTQLKDFPPKGASRAAASGKGKPAPSGKDDSWGSRIGGSGSGRAGNTLASTRRRKEAGGISNPEREMSRKIGGSASGGGGGGGGGLVEGAITDAEDMVVCVVHPGEDGAVDAADGSAAEPPPLLRSFDDDWQAFREREEASSDPWDPPLVVPLVATGSSPPLPLPVTVNPAVVDGSGRCEVILARRVAVGETVKELHLLPASPINRDGALSHSEAEHPSDRPFRLVLITTRGATVCLVCAARSPTSHYAATTATATASQPYSPLLPLERPRSGSWCSVTSASSPSSPSELPPTPTSASVSGKAARSPSEGGDQRGSSGVPYGKGDITGQGEELEETRQAVFLRRGFRFNHDVVRAAVHGCFLFVLTVEGIQVWTFPPDRPSMVLGQEASGVEGIGRTMPGTPRPCLLHMQSLEVDGVLPRSPPRCLLVVGGVRQTVLLFPPAPDQSADLAFVARQQRPRRRGFLRLYPQDEYGDESNRRRENASAGTRPQEPQPPATAPLTLDALLSGEKKKEDAGDQDGNQHNSQAETMEAKLKAWRRGFCAGRPGRTGGPHGGSGDAFPVGLALALRLGTLTEAFRRLADGEVLARRPLSVSALSAFVSAAEGLHTCLLEEAAASWRVAVSQNSFGGDGGGDRDPTGGARMFTDAVALGGVCPEVGKGMGIETVLGGLTRCWRFNREGSRCAALVGRLMLEEAEAAAAAVGSQNAINSTCTAAAVVAGQAYARACAWMLASRESVASSFERLQKAAESVTTALKAAVNTSEVQQAEGVAPATVLISTDDRSTAPLEGCFALENIQTTLSWALYENYLLPALGVASVTGSSVSSIHVSLPPLTERRQRGQEDRQQGASLEGVVEKMVEYLHARDMQRYTQPTELRQVGRGEVKCSTPLAAAVVCAGRVPWAACPRGLRYALAALEEQERALEENVGVIRDSRSRSKSGGSGSDSINLLSSGFLYLEGVACGSEPVDGALLTRSGDHAPAEEGRGSAAPAIQWIATARMVLTACSEEMNLEELGGRARGGSNNEVGLTVVDRIVELACERHPSLVVSSKSGAGGSLAKALLGMGRARPLVSALVRLTSRGAGGDCGTGGALTGPHMAQELLQLTEHCFAPPVDPLQALLVFGIPGRQIAARLDSLRRSSLDASRKTVVPPGSFESRNSDTFPQSGGGGVDRSPDGDTQDSLLQVASRDFLSRRCAASLARGGDLVALEEERLSNTWGAPEAWQTAVASNRALDRAILRYLIGAHLDDLRALEHPASSGVSGRGGEIAPISDDSSGNDRYEQPGTAVYGGRGSWAEAMFPLLTAQVSKGRGGAAKAHLDAITSLVRVVTCQGVYPEGIGRGAGGKWRGIRPSEASEVVIEAKRRLPVSATARALTNLSTVDTTTGREDTDVEAGDDDDIRSIVPWGCGGTGTEISRSPWPWGPRAVPPSAVGALVALAAALPAAGNLLGGLEVMLQVADEVVKAAKAEAAKAAGVAAAAKVGRGNGRHVEWSPADASPTITGSGAASAELLGADRIQEVSVIAKKALLLYSVEYCGRNPELWASVTEHIRHMTDGRKERAGSGSASTGAERLVEALLRQCGEEIGGRALVRALPDEMDIVECLDVVEQNLVLE